MKFAYSFVAVALLLACSSTTTPGASPDAGPARPSCDRLAEDCHDVSSAEGTKCHDLGHSTSATEDACKEAMDGCMAACAHSDAGADAAIDANTETDASDAAACKAVGTLCADNSECCTKDCHGHNGGAKMCE